jgi:hypothetical protein
MRALTEDEVTTICHASLAAGASYMGSGLRPCLLILTEDSGWREPLLAHMCGPAPEGKLRLRLMDPYEGA